jgi:hypothetical protein
VALKLDFEKAFDKVDHSFILAVLQEKGFGPLWCKWIKQLLKSATSSVLLNGIPGSPFHCKGGVRQGDPLSPLLFVLAANVFQSLVNDAMNHGLLRRPIPLQSSPWLPILQYADDTLIILQADEQQLTHLQYILPNFGNVSGLRVNYSKSNLISINVSPDKIGILTTALQYQEGSLPFTYLGLPLSTTKPTKYFFLPLIQTVLRRLPSCTMYLNFGSKLRMVNSILSSLPMFFLRSLKVY